MAEPEQPDKKDDGLFTAPEEPDVPDWLKPVSEGAIEEERRVGGRWLVPILAGSVIVLFVAIIWFLYVQGANDELAGEPRLVRAPDGPVREAPEDRGGIDVPHQDKLVYDRLTGDQRDVEDALRPAPEVPISADDQAGPVEEGAETAEDAESAAPAEQSEPPAAEGAGQVAEAGTESEAQAPANNTEDAAPQSTSEAPAPAQAPANVYRVQLAAFASTEVAEASWQRLAERFPDLLGPLEHDLQRLERNGRVLYRLRAGAFAGRDEAVTVCNRLKDRGQDCLLVEP